MTRSVGAAFPRRAWARSMCAGRARISGSGPVREKSRTPDASPWSETPLSRASALLQASAEPAPNTKHVGADEPERGCDLARSGSKTCGCGVPETPRSPGFRPATQPIADKSAPTAFGQNQQPQRSASAEGVGAWLARDLARSGSKTCRCGVPEKPRSPGFRAAAQPIADKSAPTAFGQNQQPERTTIRFCPEGVGAWLARDLARSGSKTCGCGVPEKPRSPGFRAAAQPIASKLRSYGLRPESKAGRGAWTRSISRCDPLLPGGRGSVACPRSAGHRQQNLWMRCA